MALLSWPKRRAVGTLTATISPGRLLLTAPSGAVVLDCQDDAELRAFACQLHAASVERTFDVQEAAVKASIARRAARAKATGESAGLRHSPVIERPEPPMHMDLELPA